MECPECQRQNPENAKFCMECGHNLMEGDTEIKASVPEAERKYATVLFADLSDYTALTEKLDPEEVKEMMGPSFY
jgi:class 3 adenylate cyclase